MSKHEIQRAPRPEPEGEGEGEVDITAAEWAMIVTTGFAAMLAGPLAIVPGAVLVGMWAYRINPQGVAASPVGRWLGAARARAAALVKAPEGTDDTLPAGTHTGWGDAETPAMPTRTSTAVSEPSASITVAELAAADNLLIIGNRGSGKTTLLQAILRARTGRALYIFDPHNHPDKWPALARVIGGGSDYPAIWRKLIDTVRLLVRRSEEMNERGTLRFPALTIASDEWGSVVEQIEAHIADVRLGRDDPKLPQPGRLVVRALKEGRKFGISFIASAHGDTNASLGCKGDNVAFRNSFDWFVYCGAFVKDYAPGLNPPLGRTPEGGTFPLVVAAVSPTTGERRLLDMRGLSSVSTRQRPAMTDDTVVLEGFLGETPSFRVDDKVSGLKLGVSASGREVSVDNEVSETAETFETPAEFAEIAVKLANGMTASAVAKSLPGFNGRNYTAYRERVDRVAGLLIQAATAHGGARDEHSRDEHAAQ